MLKYLLSYRYRTLFLVCFTIAGLVSSKAIMSIGVIAMFANVLLDLKYKVTLKNFFKNKALFSISLIFFASLISLSYSNDVSNGFNFVVNKLPFFVLPLAFSKMDKMTKTNFLFLINFFVFVFFATSILVVYRYTINFTESNLFLKQGKPIWVPMNHIRFNTMLVFAFISSAYLFFQKKYFLNFKKLNYKYVYGFLTVCFFILINILAVRTALLIMYLSILVSLIFYTINTKSYRILIGGILIIILTPIFFYNVFESFKNRILYMKYDWEQIINNKEIGSNSDSRRIISYKLGFQLIAKSFPLGLGTGTIQQEMNTLFDIQYPNIKNEDRIMPHNEFLYILVDYGLLGFIAILFTVFYPIISLKNKRKNLYYILLWIIVATPTLFDLSLEMQLGITFFTLFSSLILKQISNQEEYA